MTADIKYLDPKADLIPVVPIHKDTIVDVRCKDIEGRSVSWWRMWR